MASEKLEDLGVPQRLLTAIRNEIQKASQEQLNDLWMVVHSLKDSASAGPGAGPDVTPEVEELRTRCQDLTRRLDEFDADDSLTDEEIRELTEDLEAKINDFKRAVSSRIDSLEEAGKEAGGPARPDEEQEKRLNETVERLAQLEGRSELLDKVESRLSEQERRQADQLADTKARAEKTAALESRLTEKTAVLESRLTEKTAALESRLKDLGDRLGRFETREPGEPILAAGPIEGDGITDDDLAAIPSGVNFNLLDLLKVVVKHQATDLHLKAGSRPTARLSGELVPIGKEALTEDDCRKLVLAVLPIKVRQELVERREIEFPLSTPDGRFRLSGYRGRSGISASCRLLPEAIPGLAELNLPPILGDLALQEAGLLVVSGPPASGKSTTLAALLGHINAHRKAHIITVEDPIEFHHQDNRSFICQREVGTDTLAYPEAIRHACRQDPDVIAVGSVEDPACLASAVQAAQAGHLVLTTCQADNPVVALDLMLAGVAPEQRPAFQDQLAASLLAVCAQRLVDDAGDSTTSRPITELLVATPQVRSLIHEGATRQLRSEIEKGEQGMHTFSASMESLGSASTARLEVQPQSTSDSPSMEAPAPAPPPHRAAAVRQPAASSQPAAPAQPGQQPAQQGQPGSSDDALLGWL